MVNGIKLRFLFVNTVE